MWIVLLAIADPERTGAAWSPYIVGGLIGVLSWMTFYFAGKPLGASTAYAQVAGIFTMRRLGWIELKLKPTRYASQTVGGLIFGAGFALSGYCPGTGAAALGQGNLDALAVIAGMIAGSYAFAEISGWIGRTLHRVGDRGELTLPQLLRLPLYPFVASFGLLLVLFLVVLQWATSR